MFTYLKNDYIIYFRIEGVCAMGGTTKRIVIEDNHGVQKEAHLVTYLLSENSDAKYVVYSKGEVSGSDGDIVIYISRITNDGPVLKIEEITSDQEWSDVLVLLKKIANA